MNDMFSTGITPRDYWMMAYGAWKTIQMTLAAGLLATLLGIVLGLLKMSRFAVVRLAVDTLVDVLRCIPLLVQVTLIFSGFAVLGTPVSAFTAGTIALTLFSGSYIAEVVRDAIIAVPGNLRRAAPTSNSSGTPTSRAAHPAYPSPRYTVTSARTTSRMSEPISRTEAASTPGTAESAPSPRPTADVCS